MELTEQFFMTVGILVVMFYGFKFITLMKTVFPDTWYPLPPAFFTSLGQWAVITGGSDGIGRAYALELAKYGMNIVIISRSLKKLEKAAMEIKAETGREVKIISADFTQDDIYECIEQELEGLQVGVLVNNVGILLSIKPHRFLEPDDLEQKTTDMINCNIRSVLKMCKIVLPAMEKREKGLILNISSGVAYSPWPMYTLYAASKVFVERFSRGLQAEYKAKGVIIQTVTPFGVSTAMTGYQEPDIITLTAEGFVRTSLKYVRTGDHTHGSVSHAILGWLIQKIPERIFHSDIIQEKMVEFINARVGTVRQKMAW